MPKSRRIPADFWWRSARQQDQVAAEMRAKARKVELEETGHECGHQFTILVAITGHSSGVVGEVPETHTDANYSDPLLPVTVRAHNLADALHLAAELPLYQYMAYEEGEDGSTG